MSYISHFTTCRRWSAWGVELAPHVYYKVYGYDANSLYNVTIIGDYTR